MGYSGEKCRPDIFRTADMGTVISLNMSIPAKPGLRRYIIGSGRTTLLYLLPARRHGCPAGSCAVNRYQPEHYRLKKRSFYPFFSATISFTPTSFQTIDRSCVTIVSGESAGE